MRRFNDVSVSTPNPFQYSYPVRESCFNLFHGATDQFLILTCAVVYPWGMTGDHTHPGGPARTYSTNRCLSSGVSCTHGILVMACACTSLIKPSTAALSLLNARQAMVKRSRDDRRVNTGLMRTTRPTNRHLTICLLGAKVHASCRESYQCHVTSESRWTHARATTEVQYKVAHIGRNVYD